MVSCLFLFFGRWGGRVYRWWRFSAEQRAAYAVISMVCSPAWSGLGEMASPGSVTPVPRLRDPSLEPTLEAEWVLERTRRVIPAVGTRGRQKRQWGQEGNRKQLHVTWTPI